MSRIDKQNWKEKYPWSVKKHVKILHRKWKLRIRNFSNWTLFQKFTRNTHKFKEAHVFTERPCAACETDDEHQQTHNNENQDRIHEHFGKGIDVRESGFLRPSPYSDADESEATNLHRKDWDNKTAFELQKMTCFSGKLGFKKLAKNPEARKAFSLKVSQHANAVLRLTVRIYRWECLEKVKKMKFMRNIKIPTKNGFA